MTLHALCARLLPPDPALRCETLGSAEHHLTITAALTTPTAVCPACGHPARPTPAVVGIDEWAWRTGHHYGTIIVDLQQGRPIDILADRATETVATWFQAHPTVEVVARDRAEAYAAGIRQGAPRALQVADWFHLFQNVAEALEQVFTVHTQDLEAINAAQRQAPVSLADGTVAVPVPPPPPAPATPDHAVHRRAQRLALYEQVWAVHRQGYTGKAIARQLGLGKSTVFRFLRTTTFPERKQHRNRGWRSVLAPYKDLLLTRWNAGCREALRLFHTLTQQGYAGSYATVARYARRLRQAQGLTPRQRPARRDIPPVAEPATPPLTVRRAAALILKREEKRTAEDTQQIVQLQAQHVELAEAIALTQDFAQVVRQRQPEQLETWLARATQSALMAFQRFATSLREDYAAVKAGVTLPWSTGPVERVYQPVEDAETADVWARAGGSDTAARAPPHVNAALRRPPAHRPQESTGHVSRPT